ncbi:MAG: T9SS type A sorting domain-containing protein, partial [Bacteroidales bacterium]|nr:T9SS type A sorting domain-containing protein [Bacteroidales bacterium]
EFISWADGNTDNPRIVVLTNDTMFSAIFACVDSNDTVAIRMPEYYGRYVSVSPNPATGSAEVLSSFGLSRVEVFNAAGRKVMDLKAEGLKATLDVSKLPSGAYLLRIHTPQGMTTKKLVVR